MDDIINILPEKWRLTALFAIAIFPYLTRAYYAVANGGGVVGMFRALLFGTNIPKQDAINKASPPSSVDRMAGLFVAFAIPVGLAITLLLTGCATSWIDKVSQTRVASAKLGYRTVAEFNGYYQSKTNELKGTTPDLEAGRSLVYGVSTNLSMSLLTLESVENAYRMAPTNQLPVVKALNAVTANVSNIINTVNYIKQ